MKSSLSGVYMLFKFKPLALPASARQPMLMGVLFVLLSVIVGFSDQSPLSLYTNAAALVICMGLAASFFVGLLAHIAGFFWSFRYRYLDKLSVVKDWLAFVWLTSLVALVNLVILGGRWISTPNELEYQRVLPLAWLLSIATCAFLNIGMGEHYPAIQPQARFMLASLFTLVIPMLGMFGRVIPSFDVPYGVSLFVSLFVMNVIRSTTNDAIQTERCHA